MKLDLKQKLEELKAYVSRLDKKVKIISAAVAVLVVAGAIIAAAVLNHKEYVPLFSEVSDEEASEIVGKLQEDGVDYQYKGGGTILVEESQADSTRAGLVYEGYPKSGFTYDIFTQNAGGMATDSERQTYKLYELQNRIGATIALFDGVKDAKVTIALGEEQKYVLEDDAKEKSASSASVVVTMKDGAQLESKQASAIQRLVAKSVPQMEMEDVAVFDENGIELSNASGGQQGSTEAELSQIIERKIEQKVVNVLTPFYGSGNVRVSANGQVNMERVIRETTSYTTPEKIDENDKTGIVGRESGSTSEGTGDGVAGGVAGAEDNADVPEYNADGNGGTTYNDENYDREYLVDQVKEQTEINPGVMDDLTVSVSINGENYGSLSDAQVRELVANATGITAEERAQKITVVAAPFYSPDTETQSQAVRAEDFLKRYWPFLAVLAGALLLLIVVLVIVHKVRKKRRLKELAEQEENTISMPPLEEEEKDNIDILSIQNEKSRELRENVRDFADSNPEISAQMLRAWLNGGEQDSGN